MKKRICEFVPVITTIIFVFIIIASVFTSPKPVISLKNETTEKNYQLVECVIRSLGVMNSKMRDISIHIVNASQYHGIDPLLITCLIYTESGFRSKAISHKGYKGLMQTPIMTEYDEVNIIYGISILKDKLKQSNNDLEKAIFMYKGNRKPADKQAKEMLKLYITVKNIFGGRNV